VVDRDPRAGTSGGAAAAAPWWRQESEQRRVATRGGEKDRASTRVSGAGFYSVGVGPFKKKASALTWAGQMGQ
jgi:hypothetical protein